jgi:hypothetical protein
VLDVDSSVFTGDPLVTVYYLPGTTGWEQTVGGVPAVLWNPVIQTLDGNFGVQSNQFGFNITGNTNIPIVIESSTSLGTSPWVQLQSSTLTNGALLFADAQWTNYPSRLYRIRST